MKESLLRETSEKPYNIKSAINGFLYGVRKYKVHQHGLLNFTRAAGKWGVPGGGSKHNGLLPGPALSAASLVWSWTPPPDKNVLWWTNQMKLLDFFFFSPPTYSRLFNNILHRLQSWEKKKRKALERFRRQLLSTEVRTAGFSKTSVELCALTCEISSWHRSEKQN